MAVVVGPIKFRGCNPGQATQTGYIIEMRCLLWSEIYCARESDGGFQDLVAQKTADCLKRLGLRWKK